MCMILQVTVSQLALCLIKCFRTQLVKLKSTENWELTIGLPVRIGELLGSMIGASWKLKSVSKGHHLTPILLVNAALAFPSLTIWIMPLSENSYTSLSLLKPGVTVLELTTLTTRQPLNGSTIYWRTSTGFYSTPVTLMVLYPLSGLRNGSQLLGGRWLRSTVNTMSITKWQDTWSLMASSPLQRFMAQDTWLLSGREKNLTTWSSTGFLGKRSDPWLVILSISSKFKHLKELVVG